MSSMQQPKRAYGLFYSYADEDRRLLKKLEDHLNFLNQEGDIRELHRRHISPGAEWQRELDKYMKRASIILLLISPNFLGSDYLYNTELKQAVERCEARKAIIIPIILVPYNWEDVPFGNKKLSDYEVLPQSRKLVTSWSNREEAFKEIAQAVGQAVINLREYEEERRMGIVNPEPKSIYPRSNTVKPQHNSQLEDLQPNPLRGTGRYATYSPEPRDVNKVSKKSTKVDTPMRNTGRGVNSDKQRYAQFVGEGVAEPSWGKKALPKKRKLSQLREEYFTFDDFSKYDTGIRAALFLFFLAFDVGVLTLVSRYWLGSQEMTVAVGIFSSLFFFWGVFNKNGLVALALTTLFSGIWAIIGFHYLPLYPASIPVTVIAICFVLALARFFLFREYKHKKRRTLSRSR